MALLRDGSTGEDGQAVEGSTAWNGGVAEEIFNERVTLSGGWHHWGGGKQLLSMAGSTKWRYFSE